MANYATLKAAIQEVIKTNGNNEITGALLQQSLLAMINSLGGGYQYVGIATPTTNPGTPDQNVFYLASVGGTYTNFGSLVVNDGEVVALVYNGSWSKQVTGAATEVQMLVLNELINALSFAYNDELGLSIKQVVTHDKFVNNGYINQLGTLITNSNFGYTDVIAVSAGDVLQMQYVGTDIPYYNYCNSDGTFLSGGPIASSPTSLLKHTFSNDGYIRINGRIVNTSNPDRLVRGIFYVPATGTRTQYVRLEIGRLSNSGIMTEHITSPVVYSDRTYWRTPNFIKIKGLDKYKIKSSIGVFVLPCYYDADCNFIASGVPPVSSSPSYTQLTADTEKEIGNLPEGACYVKFTFRSKAGTTSLSPIPQFDFYIIGDLDSQCFVKNIRSTVSSDGYGYYMHLAVLVNPTNPYCCDSQTTEVQDTENLRFDYGVIAFPKQYSNIGKPTRLIIYCHGAGANYTLTSSGFAFDARYWLSEGYAVCDIEGNPYDNTNEHGFIPAAMESYTAAYRWIIEHYNIYPEILLAGKSMGGGETFDLLSSTIPIIASCAISPVCNYIWWWTYMNATRRSFVAQKLGFLGTAPTWTTGSPMSSAEWQFLQDNYERFIPYAPFTRLITNPPSKTELFANMNIPASTLEPTENEVALWSSRIAKAKCPVKIFAARDDSTVPTKRNAEFMFDMLRRGSCIVELRLFTTGGHHIESQTEGFVTTVTNTYNEQIEDVPVVFVEILNFWRRYEEQF